MLSSRMRKFALVLSLCALGLALTPRTSSQTPPPVPDLAALQAMAARFAPTPLQVDLAGLSGGDQKALVKLVEAARIVNTIFMRQFWSGDLAEYQKLKQDTTPLGRARLHYFWINKGPWSEIDQHAAFLPDVPARISIPRI
jgi:hypothetical protein